MFFLDSRVPDVQDSAEGESAERSDLLRNVFTVRKLKELTADNLGNDAKIF